MSKEIIVERGTKTVYREGLLILAVLCLSVTVISSVVLLSVII